MSPLSRRLRKLETLRELAADALPPLVYNVLDKNGLSVGSFLIAGERFGQFRPPTESELASVSRADPRK